MHDIMEYLWLDLRLRITRMNYSKQSFRISLKLRVTWGPHETQRKVSRAALKKVKKITFKFSSKN